MYKSVFCLMVVSIMKSVPYVLKAIPIVRLSHQLICNSILNCLSVLSQGNFVIRAIIAENDRTNLSAFQHVSKAYPITGKPNCIRNPHRSSQHIFLMFDTVHLIKNVRNNLLASRSFQVPHCRLVVSDKLHEFPAGAVYWACLLRFMNMIWKDAENLGRLQRLTFPFYIQEITSNLSL